MTYGTESASGLSKRICGLHFFTRNALPLTGIISIVKEPEPNGFTMLTSPSVHAADQKTGLRRFSDSGIARSLLIIPLFIALMAPSLRAEGNRVAVTFIPEVPGMAEAAEQGGVFWLGVDMQIKEGWHVYWRNPGDSGLPTTIRWSAHPRLKPGEIHWPRPSRFDEDGITTYGYSDRVTLLIPVSLKQGDPQPDYDSSGELPGESTGNLPESDADREKEHGSRSGAAISEHSLSADLNWLVCKDICLPESATVSMTIGDGGSFEGYSVSGADRINQSMGLVPDAAEEWQGHALLVDGRFEITLTARAGNAVFPDEQDVYFYPHRQGLIEHTAPQEVSRHEDKLTIGIPVSRYLRSAPEEISGVLSAGESWVRDSNIPAMEMVIPVAEHERAN